MNFYNHFKLRKLQIIKIYDNSDQSIILKSRQICGISYSDDQFIIKLKCNGSQNDFIDHLPTKVSFIGSPKCGKTCGNKTVNRM